MAANKRIIQYNMCSNILRLTYKYLRYVLCMCSFLCIDHEHGHIGHGHFYGGYFVVVVHLFLDLCLSAFFILPFENANSLCGRITTERVWMGCTVCTVHRALCMRTLYIIVSKIFFTLLSTFIIQLTGYICARSTRLNLRSYNSSKEYRHQCQPTIASIDQIILIWFGMCFRLTFVLSLRFLFHFLLKYTIFYHQLRTDDTRFVTPKKKVSMKLTAL